MAYDDIKKLIEQEVSSQIKANELKENDNNLYNIPTTPYHTHNQQDSPAFPLSNLADAVNYTAYTIVTLTAAEIKALHTTPKILVTPYGKASVVIVMGITAYLSYRGTAYTGANNLEFRYSTAAGAKVTVDMAATFINSVASAWDYAPAVGTELTPVAGDGSLTLGSIVVSVPTANPGTGNSPISFVVSYRVVSFPPVF